MSDFKPQIVLFCCNWFSHDGADLAGTSILHGAPHLRVIRTMCSGRVEPSFILRAFKSGADGVMIAGCYAGDCHYMSGNYKSQRRVMLLKKTLPQLGIGPERLKLDLISAPEAPKFPSSVNEFIHEVTELGALNVAKAGAN
ncbi:MAG: hydrogenase iron-sulfur subunit [Dehalococcoidia bacterium]|nr:hydrogenase iron-sulfur subunit [Dehalococcoidia bacterium]